MLAASGLRVKGLLLPLHIATRFRTE